MSQLESNINNFLNRFPKTKKIVKRIYQLLMYSISPKIKYEGNINRISPEDDMEYFFGYYDKTPWDITDRYMLCLRVKDAHSSVAPKEPADIVVFDTYNNNSYKILTKTNVWNVQQGCMLQWLGPDYSKKIIYNDFRYGKYCSVILNIETMEEKIISMPVYSVSRDGKFALTLDFSRLHRLRKGYGYSILPDYTKDEKCPDKPCIWYVDLTSGKIKPILKYTDFADFETRSEMREAEHKVNHIMLNPSGNRFMVLHRWFCGSKKYTRLITANIDGSDMYNLNDDDMTSHCYWKNDTEILAYTRKKAVGDGYYLLKDKTHDYIKLWPELNTDGHPSYSPDGSRVITDTYPDRTRMATLYLIKDSNVRKLARVFVPFKYDNDVRCDLHPRWNNSGNKICFDAAFEGKRGLYVIDAG
ncbi:hypothetical protein ODU73_000134 [Thermoclostridium stercorarium]|uniref:hypothetical protein n=1 Tax=Thermoclostridium stercorarium TaxID=1510 RepID=UPI002248847C|nr:hypothetical protein [Thermoclostridium stercorarium]UZQ85767.1 hypothetical protein ODU73_000134 [Thermoclostridium stercorarium]